MKHPPFVCHQTSSIDDFGNVVVLGSSRLGIIQGAVGGSLGVIEIDHPTVFKRLAGRKAASRGLGLWGWVGLRMIGRGG